MIDPSKLILTAGDIDALPTVEGPDFAMTADEIREVNFRVNGGIHLDGCLAAWGGNCTCL